MVSFPNRVVFVGFGAVARCTLPILVNHLNINPKRITTIDFDQNDEVLKPWIARGMTFVKDRVAPENMGSLLGQYLSTGDLLIDLAWNIDCCEIVQWCHDRGVLYVNTSVELWDPYGGAHNISTWSEPGPTAVIEHGANPGLISHFTTRSWTLRSKRSRKTNSAGLSERRSLTTPRRGTLTTCRINSASRSFIAASATRRSQTSPNR